jgi:hypothetical protein
VVESVDDMKSEEGDVSMEFSGRDAMVAEFVSLATVDNAIGRRPDVGLLLQPVTRKYVHDLIVARLRVLKVAMTIIPKGPEDQ